MKFSYVMFIFLFIVVGTGLVSGVIENLGTYKQGESVDLLQICNNCTFNNISSIVYPNSTIIVEDKNMTSKDTIRYNYTLDGLFTGASGTYIVNGFGDLDGKTTVWSYTFDINPQGIEPSDQRTESITRSVYFIFGIALILFVAFLFTRQSVPVKWTFFIASVIFFVMGFNVLSISMADEVVNPNLESFFDGFTGIAFYFYWFSAGLLIIMWFFTFFNTWILNKNLRNMQRFG